MMVESMTPKLGLLRSESIHLSLMAVQKIRQKAQKLVAKALALAMKV